MARYVLLGNSGSGKSTLAARLADAGGLAHLDLDTLAWRPTVPPERRPVADSARDIAAFVAAGERWVIEGCYADLVEVVLAGTERSPRPQARRPEGLELRWQGPAEQICADRLLWLDPGIEACLANARARPWEPHKYPSQAAQDENLAMLLDWIRDYETRDDVCSRAAHRALFDRFRGDKLALTTREAIAAFAP
jgi:adenylate kinase family enzyme